MDVWMATGLGIKPFWTDCYVQYNNCQVLTECKIFFYRSVKSSSLKEEFKSLVSTFSTTTTIHGWGWFSQTQNRFFKTLILCIGFSGIIVVPVVLASRFKNVHSRDLIIGSLQIFFYVCGIKWPLFLKYTLLCFFIDTTSYTFLHTFYYISF